MSSRLSRTRSLAVRSWLAELDRLDLVDVLVHRVEGLPSVDELGRGLLAHARHARHVVRAVALERLEVDDLVGPQVVALPDPIGVVDDRVLDARARRHQPGVVRDELEHVEVAGHDRRVEAAPLRLDRERADDVVRLVAGELVDRDPERLDDLADLGELVAQVVRHPLAGRLVLGEALVAERGSGEVEGDGHVVRPDVLEPAQDDAAEPEHGIDELTARRRERWEREIAAVDEPVAVEQHQAFHGHPRDAGGRVSRRPSVYRRGGPERGENARERRRRRVRLRPRRGQRRASCRAPHRMANRPSPAARHTIEIGRSGEPPFPVFEPKSAPAWAHRSWHHPTRSPRHLFRGHPSCPAAARRSRRWSARRSRPPPRSRGWSRSERAT